MSLEPQPENTTHYPWVDGQQQSIKAGGTVLIFASFSTDKAGGVSPYAQEIPGLGEKAKFWRTEARAEDTKDGKVTYVMMIHITVREGESWVITPTSDFDGEFGEDGVLRLTLGGGKVRYSFKVNKGDGSMTVGAERVRGVEVEEVKDKDP